MTHSILTLNAQPGIQKDSTSFDSTSYTDGQWCRFSNGKPRKRGGYKLGIPGGPSIVRGMFIVPKPDNTMDIYMGRPANSAGSGGGLFVVNMDAQGNSSAEYERTPIGYIAGNNDQWDFDLMTVPGSPNVSYIVAHVAPNVDNINNDVEGPIFVGDILITSPLVYANKSVSGGIVAVPPFLFAFGSDGVTYWSAINDPTTWPPLQFAAVAGTKLVEGYRTRGGGVPAVLLWSINSLVRGTFVGGTDNPFSFETLTDKISLLSKDSIAQVDQVFYWVGNDRKFYLYNGTVQELKNTFNKNFFFDNLNQVEKTKSWSIFISTYNEVWFLAPFCQSSECNHMISYSIAEGSWDNSKISRSCGYPIDLFQYPILADSESISNILVPGAPNSYGIWLHEFGYDKYIFNQIVAIPSFFTTPYYAIADSNPSDDQSMQIQRIEPDFIQEGDMTVIINKRKYARSIPATSDIYTFGPTTEKIDTRGIGGIISFTFTSNTSGGFYQMGKTWIDIAPSGARRSQ